MKSSITSGRRTTCTTRHCQQQHYMCECRTLARAHAHTHICIYADACTHTNTIPCIHTYIHTNIHTYIHTTTTYIPPQHTYHHNIHTITTYIPSQHTYIPPQHTYIHTFHHNIHTYVHTYHHNIHTYIPSQHTHICAQEWDTKRKGERHPPLVAEPVVPRQGPLVWRIAWWIQLNMHTTRKKDSRKVQLSCLPRQWD